MAVKVREKVKGSGVYWVFIHHNGIRKSKKVGSLDAANYVATQVEARLALGDLGFVKKKAPTFKKIAQAWLAAPSDNKDSTIETYRFNLDRHIYPDIGNTPINEIDRQAIRALLTKKNKDISSNYVRLLKAAINNVMRFALDEGLIDSNPTSEITFKKLKRSVDANPLDETETAALLSAAKDHLDGQYYPLILFLIRTGARIGETQALTWPKIDFKKRTASIDKAWRNGIISTPKSHQKRIVDLTPHLTETLKKLKRKKYVFAGTRSPMFNRETFRFALRRCFDLAEIKRRRIHDLRHTYSTLRLMAGHDIWDVSRQLGHSSISITLDTYGHWMPSKFKEQIDSMDNA